MSLIVYCVPIIVLAFVIFAIVLLVDTRDRLTRRAAAAGDLAKLGLELTGDALDSFSLRGRHEGMDLVLKSSTSAPLPGPSGRERTVCLVTFEVSMPDFVVCKRSEQDAVMGALPTVPHLRTGHSAFDREYAVFSQAGDSDGTAGFRTAPAQSPRWWVPEPVVEQLLDLGLEWARVQHGRAELAMKPVHSGTAARAIGAACNLAKAMTAPTVPLPPPGTTRAAAGTSPWVPALAGGGLSLFGLVFGGPLLGFLPLIRDAWSTDVCGAHSRLVILDHGDSYSVGCDKGYRGNYSIDAYYFSCGILFVAVALVLCSLLSVRALVKRKNEATPE
jgi:hypothetical protein